MGKLEAHLTDAYLGTVPCPARRRRVQVWDSRLHGFLVEVSSRSRRFVVRYRGRYLSLGRWPLVTARQARIAALETLRGIEMDRLGLALEESPGGQQKAPAGRIDTHAPPSPVHPTLRAALEEYLRVRKVKERTAHGYRYCLEKHWADYLEEPLSALTGDRVVERFRTIASPSLGNQSLRIIRAIFRFYNAAHEETLPIPTAKVLALEGAHHLEPRSRLILDSQQREWYLSVLNSAGPTGKDLLLLLACSGLRLNEARTLERRDIDLELGQVTIRETKNRKPHTMPLGTRMLTLLGDRLKTTPEAPTAPVFTINERNVRLAVSQVVEDSGIPWSCHDLRRGFVSMATRLEVPDRMVKRLVNHAEGDVTGRHYIHISPDALRPHVQVVEDVLWGMWEASGEKPTGAPTRDRPQGKGREE